MDVVACNEYRSGKVQCDGSRPRCQKCVLTGLPCFYDTSQPKANMSKTYNRHQAKRRLIERYVQRLHEQIRLLQDELSNKAHGEESSDTIKSPVRRTSAYGEQSTPVEFSTPMMRVGGNCILRRMITRL